jgi:hypothetical protein
MGVDSQNRRQKSTKKGEVNAEEYEDLQPKLQAFQRALFCSMRLQQISR